MTPGSAGVKTDSDIRAPKPAVPIGLTSWRWAQAYMRAQAPPLTHVQARPSFRPSLPRLALPVPLDGHARPTGPPLLASCTQKGVGQGCTAILLLRFLRLNAAPLIGSKTVKRHAAPQGVFTRYHLRYIERNALQSRILARLMHPYRTPA